MSDPRPCEVQYGPHERHSIDCATVQEWNAASRQFRLSQEAPANDTTKEDNLVSDYLENAGALADARALIDALRAVLDLADESERRGSPFIYRTEALAAITKALGGAA